MSATDWLSALNFPASAETTSTIGTDRLDIREPPDQYHVGGLQLARMRTLLQGYSEYFAGMTRLRLVAQSANPFGAATYGYYVHTLGGGNQRYRGSLQIGGVDTLVDIPAGAVTTKGDLLIFNGTTWTRLAAGTNRQPLIADSSTASGLAFATRLHAVGGAAHVAGDFAMSVGWGDTAAASAPTGTDSGGRITITANGAGIAASPTVTFTFKDGTWTNAPTAAVSIEAASDATDLTVAVTNTTTATTLVWTFRGLPVAARTYTFQWVVIGG